MPKSGVPNGWPTTRLIWIEHPDGNIPVICLDGDGEHEGEVRRFLEARPDTASSLAKFLECVRSHPKSLANSGLSEEDLLRALKDAVELVSEKFDLCQYPVGPCSSTRPQHDYVGLAIHRKGTVAAWIGPSGSIEAPEHEINPLLFVCWRALFLSENKICVHEATRLLEEYRFGEGADEEFDDSRSDEYNEEIRDFSAKWGVPPSLMVVKEIIEGLERVLCDEEGTVANFWPSIGIMARPVCPGWRKKADHDGDCYYFVIDPAFPVKAIEDALRHEIRIIESRLGPATGHGMAREPVRLLPPRRSARHRRGDPFGVAVDVRASYKHVRKGVRDLVRQQPKIRRQDVARFPNYLRVIRELNKVYEPRANMYVRLAESVGLRDTSADSYKLLARAAVRWVYGEDLRQVLTNGLCLLCKAPGRCDATIACGVFHVLEGELLKGTGTSPKRERPQTQQEPDIDRERRKRVMDFKDMSVSVRSFSFEALSEPAREICMAMFVRGESMPLTAYRLDMTEADVAKILREDPEVLAIMGEKEHNDDDA